MASTTLPLDPPIWVKTISILGIIWYAFGLLQFWLAYSMDTTAAATTGTITPALASTPTLIWLTFALASGAGLLGTACLLLGSRRATLMFALSAISAILYYLWVYALSGSGADRPNEELPIAAVVIAVTLAFLYLSKRRFS